jgi:hypothetical protein
LAGHPSVPAVRKANTIGQAACRLAVSDLTADWRRATLERHVHSDQDH